MYISGKLREKKQCGQGELIFQGQVNCATRPSSISEVSVSSITFSASLRFNLMKVKRTGYDRHEAKCAR